MRFTRLLPTFALISAAIAAPQSETRTLAPFRAVNAKGGLSMEIVRGDVQTLTITSDSGPTAKVETRIENDTLILKADNRWFRKRDLKIRITVPALTGLTLDGATDVEADGFNAAEFRFGMYGSGEVKLAGVCGKGTFIVKGSGTLFARNFRCDDVTVEMRGRGDVEVHARNRVNAIMRGWGDIDVYGGPPNFSTDKAGIGAIRLHGKDE